jgi:hypothetical protein
MNISDILIIYLALGAPVGVYKFLQSRDLATGRRTFRSILAWLFWIPTAMRLVYRSVTNAYSRPGFVSQRGLDSSDPALTELRENIRLELTRVDRGTFPPHLVREVLERYIGLSRASNAELPQIDDGSSDLFVAAGRSEEKLATICLMRRNQRRIERHHIKARRSFLELFERAVTQDAPHTETAVRMGLELASQLGDKKAIDGLHAIAANIRDEVWNPQGQQQVLSSVSAQISPLSMKTAPFNND